MPDFVAHVLYMNLNFSAINF